MIGLIQTPSFTIWDLGHGVIPQLQFALEGHSEGECTTTYSLLSSILVHLKNSGTWVGY